MQAYSKEMRRDILAAYAAGDQTKQIALRFKVSEAWCRRVKQEFRELGKTAPCSTRRRVPKWLVYADQLRELVRQQPDLTLEEIRTKLGTTLCVQTVCNALHALKLSFKKK